MAEQQGVAEISRLVSSLCGPAPKQLRDAQAFAPSNIALAKYWGKRDEALNLPHNSSVSISLGTLGTHTKISAAEYEDQVYLAGKEIARSEPFAIKVMQFVELFRRGQKLPVKVETTNTIPTAAGLASSASGFAALMKALNHAFDLALTLPQQSMFSRFGSGSATRSFWDGFVTWERGLQADGRDSFGVPLTTVWPEFRLALIPVNTAPKSHSSRDGMNHTTATSPLYPSWPEQAEEDTRSAVAAIEARDFKTLGPLCEANALAMHATMSAARPALHYLTEQSWGVLETLSLARSEGLFAFATMDAGPNIKLLYLQDSSEDVLSLFPQRTEIIPFRA
ncbi:MAG: diphosphomevalonate decarboxylase [Pseudomonadota bacterium]